MNWLILLYFLELGYSPFYQSLGTVSNLSIIENHNIYYVKFDTEAVLWDHIFIGGSNKIFMQPAKNDYEFYPIEDDFLFKVEVRFKHLELGFRHQCNHPVLNYGVATNGKAYGGFEEYYIKITNEF